MKIGTVFSVILYAAIVILFGAFLISIATNYIPYDLLQLYVQYLYGSVELRIYLGVLGGLLIFLSFLLFHVALGPSVREKKVFIKGKDGMTQISLSSPVENIVREVAKELGTITDARQDVYKWKKGIRIDVKLAVKPGVNIRDVSEVFRGKVINKVRGMIGVEGPIEVNVFVWKVADAKKKQSLAKQEPKFTVPYREMDV